MRVLVVGGGGREHAICWKLKQSPRIEHIYCAPGNNGIGKMAECVNIAPSDIDKLVQFAKDNKVNLTVVGMDEPLALGIVDAFTAAGLRIFGPNKEVARIESSKVFAKAFMKRYGIPTADSVTFSNYDDAIAYIKQRRYPLIVKADGLALGKGVAICQNQVEACFALNNLMIKKVFGESGERVIIEDYMVGRECSVLTFVDGKTAKAMPSAKDHKRAYDNDLGDNTGGMGTISPCPYYTDELARITYETIIKPTVDGLAAEGLEFKGILFFGLMLTESGPKVIEYNARFGDPETQVVLPRLKTDLADVIDACIDGNLDKLDIEWTDNTAVCVVAASGGYPGHYEKGYTITGIDTASAMDCTLVFEAGTKKLDNRVITNGGRVLGVTGMGESLKAARERAYAALMEIEFTGMYYRKDIK